MIDPITDSVASAFIVSVIVVGLKFESKMQIILMVVLWASIFDFYAGTFVSPDEQQRKRGMTGYRSQSVITYNLNPHINDGWMRHFQNERYF